MPPHCGQCRKQMASVMPQIMTLHSSHTPLSLLGHLMGMLSAVSRCVAQLKRVHLLLGHQQHIVL